MERPDKGQSVNHYVKDYCVIDLETTGLYIGTAKIIEISALRIRDGVVDSEYSTLVNPKCHIPEDATNINNITDEMVENAPVLEDVIGSFMEFIGDDILVGYNNAGFDLNILYDALMNLKGKALSNNYIDVLHVARRSISTIENYRLETVSKYFGLDTIGEHRALKDCYLTKDCYEIIHNRFGDSVFAKYTSSGERHPKYATETLALQELLSILEDVIEDGKVTLVEFSQVKDWMENHRDLQGNYPFDRVFDALDCVLLDGKITFEELEELQILFSDIVDPVSNRATSCYMDSILNKHVCVTGDFDYGTRDQVFSLIETAGGIIDKSVKKTTSYLVVGSKGSDNWKTNHYGSKIQKAMEYNEKGSNIMIIEENEFIPQIQAIIDNPNPQKEHEAKNECVSQSQDTVDWQASVREMLISLTKQYELPEGSLYMNDNYSKVDPTKLVSHIIYIGEPSYPPLPNETLDQNKLVLTIKPSTAKSRPDDLDIVIRVDQAIALNNSIPADAEVLAKPQFEEINDNEPVSQFQSEDSDSSDGIAAFKKIRFKKHSKTLTGFIRQNVEYCIKHYKSKEKTFGCCSSFIECSDAKKCIHPNKLYSTACMYRENLEKGKIFYGKNKNIGN